MRLSVFSRSKRITKLCRRTRVLLNDEDVTDRCQMLDTREGWVLLLKKDAAGGYTIKNDSVVKERLHGKVRIVR